MDKYTAHMIEKAQASGASAAAIQAKVQQLNNYKAQYEKLWFNAAVTFLEPFPVGLVITLLSSAILRKRPEQRAAVSVPAS